MVDRIEEGMNERTFERAMVGQTKGSENLCPQEVDDFISRPDLRYAQKSSYAGAPDVIQRSEQT